MSGSSGRTAQAPGFYRFKIGAFEGLALHDGVIVRDRPAGFIRNADEPAVAEAFAAAGMAADKLTLTFNPLAIDTGSGGSGSGIVLIDTGMGDGGPAGSGKLAANLQAAGISPADVKTVIISHFHGDHIAGLRGKDGSKTYPNATVMVPRPEWDHWTDPAKKAAAPDALKGSFDQVAKTFDGMNPRQFDWGDEILPGFKAVKADGHTPGMAAIEIASEGDKLLYVADITNNPLIFVRNPTWQAMFDMDPEQATRTRRTLLDRAAQEKQRLFFFHAPFPCLAYVGKNGDAYEYLPALWSA